ncbi:Ferripyoverdine receptor [compost metagenome]
MFVWRGKYDYETSQNAYDLYASGPFQLGGREHELVVGLSHRDIESDETNWPFFFDPAPSVFGWNGDFPEPDWGSPQSKVKTELKESAAYLTSRFKPTDDLSIILGSRVSDWKLDSTGTDLVAGQSAKLQSLRETGVVVPYAGVVYDLNDTYSVYASYTSIFKPHESEEDASGKAIEPEEGDAYELGLKAEFFDGRLNASAAVFEVRQDNLADPVDQVGNDVIYRAVQGAKTKGFELELAGELMPDWQVQGGYTHRITRDGDDNKISTTEPEDMFRLSTSYRLPGQFNKLTIGGSASWQSKIWQNIWNPVSMESDYEYTQESYWVLDAMAKYQVTEQVSVTLNANNLTDEKYFSNLGFYDGGFYGDPRNYMLTTRFDF